MSKCGDGFRSVIHPRFPLVGRAPCLALADRRPKRIRYIVTLPVSGNVYVFRLSVAVCWMRLDEILSDD